MQWWINIIYEKCKDYIDAHFATHPPVCCFTDRGDPNNPDWTDSTLIGDNAWHDLDLSGIIPAKSTGVVLRVAVQSPVWNEDIRFRKKGHTGWPNVAECRYFAVGRVHHYDKIIAVDENCTIQYKLSCADWTTLIVTVAAWYVGGDVVGGFQNRGDPAAEDFTGLDLPAYQTWTDLDLTGIIPAETSSILLCVCVRSAYNQRSLRFRTKGHSNDINISRCEAIESGRYYYYDIQVPTNGLQVVQYWSSLDLAPGIKVTVKGWLF